ncbi:MAG: maleylpyruvate isomerase family mycothiol-dependent enzyme, partial [Candidatus Binatia bacterium]
DAPSLCEGWSVADVVLHLAQSEEAVLGTTAALGILGRQASAEATMDEVVDQWVAGERGRPPVEYLERWVKAQRSSLDALRSADPSATFPWATNPLKPKTLATTRLSEHWIHANDIAQPLGLDYPDTDRLWHIARLAQRTIPYAYARAGRDDPPTVRAELTRPRGESWVFGDEDAQCVITGSASEFCRIAARRLPWRDAKTIDASSPRADEVLELVRTYA